MKRKLLSLLVTLALVLGLIGGQGVFAAVKKVPVSEEIDEVYWMKQGNQEIYAQADADATYKTSADSSWDKMNWLAPWTKFKGDRDICVEFEIKEIDALTTIAIQPYNDSINGFKDWLYFSPGNGSVVPSAADHTSTGNYANGTYPEVEIGGPWESNLVALDGASWTLNKENLSLIRFVGRTDGSVSLYIWESIANGNTEMHWREAFRSKPDDGSNKNYYAKPDPEQEYYVSLGINGYAEIDNLRFYTPDGDTETVIAETNFNDDKLSFLDTEAEGKIYASLGRISPNSELTVTNATENDMLVTTMPVTANSISKRVFSVDAQLAFETLPEGRKLGIGVTQLTADELEAEKVTHSGASYFYLTEKAAAEGTTTWVGHMKGGEIISESDLGVTLTGGSFHSFRLLGKRDGSVEVTIDDLSAVTFEDAVVEGYIAIAALGEGDFTYAIMPEVSVIRFDYSSSEDGSYECNFNEFMNPEHFFVSTTSTAGFANGAEAVGIEQVDGKLFFNGSGTNSVFSVGGMYADFVFEFDYTSFAIEDRPEKAENWMFGYSDLTIAFGNETPYGWGRGAYQLFIKDFATRQWSTPDEPYQGYGSVKLVDWRNSETLIGQEITISDGSDTVDEQGKHTYTSTAKEGFLSLYAVTTRIKLVVADNQAVLYAVTMEEDKPLSEYRTEDYVKLGEWPLVNDTYGRVSICADENAYFQIDNVRLTRLDGAQEEDVQTNLAAYEDFKEIADDPRPTAIDAPVLSLEGNVVSWNAVPNATKYAVQVGSGEIVEVTGTSYTVEVSEYGSYPVRVRAIGDGNKNLDSNWATVTYVYEEPAGGCGGCAGGASTLLAVLTLGLISAIKRR